MTWFILAILFLLWSLIQFFFKTKTRLPDVRMPGPRQLPVIGNVHQLDSQRLHVSLQELAQKYGSIYKIRMLSEHWVVLNSFDAAYEALVTKGKVLSGRPTSFRFKTLIEMGHFSIFEDLTERAIITLKLIGRAVKYTAPGSEQNKRNVEEASKKLMEYWQTKKHGVHDANGDLFRYTACVLLKVMVGDTVDRHDVLIDDILQQERMMTRFTAADASGIALDSIPWLRYFRNQSWTNFVKGLPIAKSIFTRCKPDIICSHTGDFDEFPIHVFMKEADKRSTKVTEDMIRSVMNTVFIAGTTTTSTALYVSMLVLACYPEIRKKVQLEIDSVVGNNEPEIKYKDDMPYTEATILECTRNSSIVPLLVPHKVMEDTSLSGYHVPQGTNVFINAWAIHHDRDFWDEPFGYKPERFLDDDGLLLPPDHPRRRRVLAFGIGSRNCPGEMFAKTRVFLFIVKICQMFNMSVGKECDSDAKCVDPRLFIPNGFTLEPKSTKINFEER